MLRRKLSAYSLMFAAGIAAGYFICEKARPAAAAGFLAALIAAIYHAYRAGAGGPASETYCTADKDNASARCRAAALICLAAGLICFTSRCAFYDSVAAAYTASYDDSGIYDSTCDSSSSDITAEDDFHTLKGRVLSSKLKDDDLSLVLRTGSGITGTHKTAVTLYDFYQHYEAADALTAYLLTGAVVECSGEYRELMPADDPGCFDYRLYMRSKGVAAAFRATDINIIEEGRGVSVNLKRKLYIAREGFLSKFDEDSAGFIRGVVFGDKSEMDEDTLNEFNDNSTGHILAVSGLHIGFLYGLLRILTGKRRTRTVSVLIIVIMLLYGEMTMWSAATVRACIVTAISLLSVHLKRHSDLLTSVSLAALLILVYEPYQLFNTGFQMSFLALLGIAFLTAPISSLTGEALGVMFAVQIGTLPVTAYTFCRFDPLAIFINIPVILLASVLVPLCILMLAINIFTGMTVTAGIKYAELISYAILKINHLLNLGGAFTIKTAGIGGAAVIAVYVLLFGLSSEWVRVNILRGEHSIIIKNAVLIIMPVIMISSCLFDTIADDEVVFVAVGQGDCTHIRCDGHDILIDGGGRAAMGNDGSEAYNVGENILMPYLLHEGAPSVDIALVTHLHTDHFKGITELAQIYPVGALGIPADYRGADLTSILEQEEVDKLPRIIYMEPGTKINVSDEVDIEVIWPSEVSEEPTAADDPNEHNAVYMIHYGKAKIMVTGDLLEEDEKKMTEYYAGTDVLKCDVLKVAHHGSKSSSSETFLDAASPSTAVIQVGRNNMYGHPHQQTIERLQERGIKVLRTDINGAVGLDIKKERIKIDTYRSNAGLH